MSEQTKTDDKSSQVPSGIAIVAIILSLFVAQDTIFKPTRPPMMNTERAFSEDVRSRLWQDPFQAVEEYLKQNHTHTQEAPNNSVMPEEISYKNENNKPVEIIFKKTENNSNGKNVLIAAADSDDKYAYEYSREPRQVCYSPKMKNDRTNSYRDSKLIANSIEELNCQIEIETDRSQQGLHILAVMVPGGPYADDKEWRLRSRYAVISALTELHYTPKDSEHIDFVNFDRICKAALRELRADKLKPKLEDSEKKDNQDVSKELKENTHFCHMGAFMPYEWFKKDENETVLLLWLNSSEFISTDNITPLKMLAFLKSRIGEPGIPRPLPHFSIIGPDGSGALEKMYREVRELGEKNEYDHNLYKKFDDSYIYTATATVSQKHLDKDYSVNPAINKDYDQEIDKDWLDKRIIRTISTQEKLIDSLLCELALRGVIPYYVGDGEALSMKCPVTISGELKLKKGNPPHHIVLIGERDTYYSQKMTDSFLEAINKFNAKNPQKFHPTSNKKPEWVHTYSYLRGLDGTISEHSSNQKEEKNKKKESQANKLNDTETREQKERPVGSSQLDYLLNLAEQIKNLDKLNANEGGIKAIGITGSDAYDKLLILQALRGKFPGILFFTTDLDARFFHPTEIKWTRNLLVASPFGLQLNRDLQEHTPPFRDNYQTSLYLTTQFLLCSPESKRESKLCAPTNPKKTAQYWTDSPRLFEIGNYGAVNISHEHNDFLDSTGDSRLLKDREFNVLIPIILVLLAILVIFFIPQAGRFTLFIVTLLSILFIFYVQYLLRLYLGFEFVSFTNGTSMWPSVIMKILAILLSAYFFVRIHKKILEDRKNIEKNYLILEKPGKNLSKQFLLWLKETKLSLAILIASIFCDRSYKKRKRIFFDDWGKTYYQKMYFRRLWNEYLDFSKWRFALIRIIPALAITVCFCFAAIFTFNDVSFHHIRGQSNDTSNLRIFGIAVLLYVILILYIADKVHVSSHFIKLLADPKIEVDWPDDVKKTYQNKYGLPEEVVKNRILLDFINDHTSVPNKFIYYPFFCLFLIIMSRNYYFDNWPTTPFVLSVYAFFAFLTLISAIRLRAAALYARERILEKLVNNSRHAPVNAIWHKKNDNPAKLKSFIDEIREFKEGIYRPLAYHPMVLNLLVPFSSIGGIYLIEYLI